MRPDADDVAAVVQAYSFELLGPSGSVVADLGSVSGPPARSSLDLIHSVPGVGNTRLDWTTGGNVSPWNGTRLMGPDASGQPATPADSSGTQTGALILQESETFFPDAVAAAIRAGAPIFEDGLGGGSAGLPAAEVRVRRNAAGALATGSAYNNLGTSYGIFTAQPGFARLQAGSPGNGAPSVDVLPPHVSLNPNTNGGVQVNGKNVSLAYQGGNPTLGANTTVGYRSFVGPQLTLNNVASGDIIWVTINARVLCTVAAGAQITELQVNGPGGAFITTQRLIGTQWAVNHDCSMSGSFYIQANLGDGSYVLSMVGGQTGGTWVYVAPDTWLAAVHFTRR